jgi:phosphoribosylaminoimidazolecarboxamide formyltransferase/IMP cyclohydrolase
MKNLHNNLQLMYFALQPSTTTLSANFLAEPQISTDEHVAFTGKFFHELRYGENPHQKAGIYATQRKAFWQCAFHRGKQISYNNFSNLDAAFFAAYEFIQPACAIVKHASPCASRLATNILDAYSKALRLRQTLAFGALSQ